MHHSINRCARCWSRSHPFCWGPDAAPEAVRLCAMSVHAQCHAVIARQAPVCGTCRGMAAAGAAVDDGAGCWPNISSGSAWRVSARCARAFGATADAGGQRRAAMTAGVGRFAGRQAAPGAAGRRRWPWRWARVVSMCRIPATCANCARSARRLQELSARTATGSEYLEGDLRLERRSPKAWRGICRCGANASSGRSPADLRQSYAEVL